MGFWTKSFLRIAALGCLGLATSPRLPAQTLTTVAGNCTGAYAGDGGPATQASLFGPDDLAFDSAGNYYIGDAGSNTVRKVNITTGIISTYAGVYNPTGNPSAGNGGPATQAVLYYPSGLAFDSQNNLYIADFYSSEVRKVAAAGGTITAYAGTGTYGYSGDGGPAAAAKLSSPAVVRFDPTGHFLAISDEGNSTVREVDTATGFIKTIAGTGTAGYSGDGGPATMAKLNQPDGLAFDAAGDLYIADNQNGVVRRVDASTGFITTVAGSGVTGYLGDGGPATLAELSNDMGNLNFDCDGNLLIADGLNNRVRRVDGSTGLITTVIGTGNNNTTCATSGTGVLTTNVNLPQALAFDRSGDLYLAVYGYSLIQEVVGGLCPPPVPSGGCDTIGTYSYPNPATGGSMNFLYVLCQPGPVKITVYNSAAQRVATYTTNGSEGSNTYSADVTSYAHGVYYYLVTGQEGAGTVKSKPTKFAVARKP